MNQPGREGSRRPTGSRRASREPSDPASPSARGAEARPGFLIDAEKCTECERCMSACSLAKIGAVRLADARITIERRWPEPPAIAVCRFDACPGQPCIDACPVGAIANRSGYVLIDREACTGCEACLEACPFQAIRMDAEQRAFKCDFCAGRPACVPECFTQALREAGKVGGRP